jgi:hypothetical protein
MCLWGVPLTFTAEFYHNYGHARKYEQATAYRSAATCCCLVPLLHINCSSQLLKLYEWLTDLAT